MNVGSAIELYTTVMGWQFYADFWDVFTGTGIAFIPFIVIIVKNFAQGYRGRPGDGAEQSVRAMELDIFEMMTVIVLVAQPVMNFNPGVLEFKPACTASGAPGDTSQTIGNTGTTYDAILADAVDSEEDSAARIPVWWMGVMSISGGVTRAMSVSLPCAPNMRSVRNEIKGLAIKNPATQREYEHFRNQCWLPAYSKFTEDPDVILDTTPELHESHDTDNEWEELNWINADINYSGSHAYLDTPGYYDTLKPLDIPSSMPIDSDPTCKEWWEGGLKERLSNETSGLMDTVTNIVGHLGPVGMVASSAVRFTWNMASDEYDDDMAIMKMENNGPATLIGTGFGNSMVPGAVAVGAGGAAAAGILGVTFSGPILTAVGVAGIGVAKDIAAKGVDFYITMYLVRESLVFVQAFILMAIYAFLPALLVFSGFRMMPVLTATLGIFTVKFWTVLWYWVAWLDSNLTSAIYGSAVAFWKDGRFIEGIILDIVTMSLYLGLPVLFSIVVGWAGVQVGSEVGRTMQTSVKGSTGVAKGSASKAMNTKPKPRGK